MLRSVVITDLTRMQGNRVCIAGYAVTKGSPDLCIRPELVRGEIREPWLYQGGSVLRPFSRVQLDLRHPEPDPPHTEDWIVDREYTVLEPALSEPDRWALLTEIDDGSIAEIYGDDLRLHRFPHVVYATGSRSLGTVFPQRIESVAYFFHDEKGTWRYRLRLKDGDGTTYDLPVTDLAFRSYLDHRRLIDGVVPERIARQVAEELGACLSVALRVGPARPRTNDHQRACSLQINGVYTEPDYLSGRCFADLVQRSEPGPLPDVPF